MIRFNPSQRVVRAILFTALCVCLAALSDPSAARQLEFAGYTWDVRDRNGGPGPNRFSDDADDVWVDDLGRLHLTLQPDNGFWSATEVVSAESFGYGEYRWKLATNFEDFDRNTVLGLFTYENDAREIDIEFSRFGNDSRPLGNFTKQGDIPLVTHRFDVDLNGSFTTHLFTWTPDQIDWTSAHGHTDEPADAIPTHQVMARSQYAGSNIPPDTGDDRAHMNLWGFRGNPPTDGQSVEIIIADFDFTPLADAFRAGDYNGNGAVEQGDLDLVLTHWGSDPGTAQSNGWTSNVPDSPIDQGELDAVLSHWGTTGTPNLSNLPVPEPAAAGLLVVLSTLLRRPRQTSHTR